MKVKTLFIFILLSLISTQSYSAKTDDYMNNLFSAIADLSEERARELVSSRTSRDIRKNLCGYDAIEFSEPKEAEKLYNYFKNTCDSIKYSIDENLLANPEFISGLKHDLIFNEINRMFESFDGFVLKAKADINGLSRKLEFIDVLNNQKIKNTYFKRTKNLIEISLFAFENKEKELDRYEFLKNHIDDNNVYYQITDKKSRILTDISKGVGTQLFTINAILDTKLKKVKKIKSFALNKDIDLLKAVIMLDIIDHNMMTLNQLGDDYTKLRDEITDKLTKLEHKVIEISYLLDSIKNKRYSKLYFLFIKKLRTEYKALEIEGEIPEYATRVIKTVALILNQGTKNEIKGTLKSYMTELDSYSIRYNEPTFTLGALVGLDVVGKDEVDESNRAYVQLFAPFGVIYGYKQFGIMGHAIDVGEYFNSENADNDVKWQDAISPGIAFFWRPWREYPVVMGIDYTRIGKREDEAGMDIPASEITRFIISIQTDLWHLN